MSYELGGLLLDSYEKYVSALAESWMWGDGLNNDDQVRGFFEEYSDAQLAAELFDGWLTEQNPHEVTMAELAGAMGELRGKMQRQPAIPA